MGRGVPLRELRKAEKAAAEEQQRQEAEARARLLEERSAVRFSDPLSSGVLCAGLQ